jgi:hypothetical protein
VPGANILQSGNPALPLPLRIWTFDYSIGGSSPVFSGKEKMLRHCVDLLNYCPATGQLHVTRITTVLM